MFRGVKVSSGLIQLFSHELERKAGTKTEILIVLLRKIFNDQF